MSRSQAHETLEKGIKSLQTNFVQVLTSGCHYNTSEITKHIQHINNALDNIKLDFELQRGSKSWSKQFDVNEMKLNETNIQQIIAQGNELTEQLNVRLHTEAMKNKEHNQIRETHNWACDSLVEYLQVLQPYASSSYARLDNMAHHLGVTDRFVGYRNNLTRYASQSTNVNTIWADRKLPVTSTPDWKDWAYTFQHPGSSTASTPRQPSNDNQNAFSSMTTTQPIGSRKNVSRSFNYTNDYNALMNRVDMNIKYPGTSETFDRFSKPKGPSDSPSYPVAQADYTSIGRPLARLVSKTSCSEYVDRYIVPDATKIERYPWLRP